MENEFVDITAGTSPSPAPVDTLVIDADRDRSRVDRALSTARGVSSNTSSRRGIPGLRKELFPAASWRRELDLLELAQVDRDNQKSTWENARVTQSLAALRAEDILQTARQQARRLVGTAAAVAQARREQAERAAATALAEAEKVTANTLAAAEQQAQEISAASGEDVTRLNERLLRLRTTLQEAEVKLGAYSTSTRLALSARGGAIDLDVEEQIGRTESEVYPVAEAVDDSSSEGFEQDDDAGSIDEIDHFAAESYAVPAPLFRPKSRFTVPGLTPDRIETLRDELTP